MTAAEFILRVKNALRNPEVWTKGSYERSNGQVCLVGAVHRVQAQFPESTPEATRAKHRLHQATASSSIEDWNDNEYRTHDDILSALDSALAIERQATSRA